MLVYKFGGTSVGSADRIKAVGKLVVAGDPKIVVLSAVSGTTNRLTEIAQFLYHQDKEAARNAIATLKESYLALINELFATPEYLEKGKALIDAHFRYLTGFTLDLFTVFEERAILAQGELISTALLQYHLEEENCKSVLLSALDFMRIDKDSEPDEWYISSHLQKELEKNMDVELFITQGYICRNRYGEIDNLKRGGSDYSASLIGAAVRASEIQIWTDIDGMHNNDPRIVDKTYPIERLSYDEAAELAYFGAKILHPSSVLPARQEGIPVRLKNTLAPEAAGTLISTSSDAESIKAVAAKDGIVAVKVRSGRMLMAYGFLRHIFEVFERYKTPIDMITTSEVAVSLTIDDDKYLDQIKEDLSGFGDVEISRDQTIICLVGEMIADGRGNAALIFEALKEIPIRMISYGGSRHNISILVDSAHKKEALQALNTNLFYKDR